MARRSFAGGVGQFFQGFNQSYDTIGKVMQDYELAKIAAAKPEESQGYTAADGQQLEAIANARDAQGNPYYTLGADAQGNYTVTPNFNTDAGAPSPAVTIARKGVTDFMGKRVEGSMPDDQINRARLSAIADVLMKSDPAAAIRIRHDLSREARADKVMQRQEQEWAHSDEDRAKKASYETARQEAFNNSIYGQQQTEYANQLKTWREAMKAHEASGPGAGPAPQQPARPAYSLADQLADRASMLVTDAQHGRLDARSFAEFTEQMRKAQDEGYVSALRMAASGAPLEQIVAKFNESGAIRLDPRAIVADEVVKRPDGVSTRIISVRAPDGSIQKIDTVATLDSLGKASDVFTRFFQGKADQRGDAQLELAKDSGRRAERQLELSVNADRRAGAAATQTISDKKALMDVRGALYQQENPNATPAQIEAARRGVLNVGDKVDDKVSPQSKLARELVKAGVAPDEMAALEMVLAGKRRSPNDMYQEFVSDGIKQYMPADMAVAAADKTMRAMGYEKVNGQWRQGAGDTGGGSAKARPPAKGEAVYEPKTDKEFQALPRGAVYRDPDDKKLYRKP